MSALTRGPLPARVYWTRRILVLVVVAALVLGIALLLQMGGDGSSDPEPQARLAADSSPSSTGSTAAAEAQTAGVSGSPAPAQQHRAGKQRDAEPSPTLAAPEGTCAGSDVAVTPKVKHPVAGSPVTLTLSLRTISSPACTWRVTPSSVTVKITSGKDDIWSSQDCPRGIPRQDVVLRNDHTTRVDVTWSARRSDDECSRYTEWAMPGWYHVNAAALAGEPSDLQFELVAPKPAVVTKTVEPKQDTREGDDAGRGGRSDDQPKHR